MEERISKLVEMMQDLEKIVDDISDESQVEEYLRKTAAQRSI